MRTTNTLSQNEIVELLVTASLAATMMKKYYELQKRNKMAKQAELQELIQSGVGDSLSTGQLYHTSTLPTSSTRNVAFEFKQMDMEHYKSYLMHYPKLTPSNTQTDHQCNGELDFVSGNANNQNVIAEQEGKDGFIMGNNPISGSRLKS